MELQDKVVVVVGGGGGIGRAGAFALSSAGCALVVADKDAAAAIETAAEIQQAGGRAVAAGCDATDESQLAELAERSTAAFGHVDVLWNHSGTALAGPPERIPVERWQELFDLNVLGGVRGMQAFLPAMLQRGSGHLIFTSSGLGLFPEDVPGLAAPYAVTKAAQIALARNLAPYLSARGVGVTVLVPDSTATNHAFDIPTVDLDPALLAATVDPETMQQPEHVANMLIDGLRADTFLISTVPSTRERLVAGAERRYAPPASRLEPVVQYVRIEAAIDKHDELASMLTLAAQSISREPGAVTYQVSADVEHRGVFHLFEEWSSGADLDRHAATAAAQAMLGRMGEFGIAGLQVRRYAVTSTDDASVNGSAS